MMSPSLSSIVTPAPDSDSGGADSDEFAANNVTVQIHQSPFVVINAAAAAEDGAVGDDSTLSTTTALASSSSLTSSVSALIVLNAPVQRPPSPLFQALWKASQFHVCADGGANRLYRATAAARSIDGSDSIDGKAASSSWDNNTNSLYSNSTNNCYIPDLIVGDLDSLQPAVREYYEQAGCKIEQIVDQDRNDLDKALEAVVQHQQGNPTTSCFVYGAFGGRFDQEMASFQALYQWNDRFLPHHNLWLYDDHNCGLLLSSAATGEGRICDDSFKKNNSTIQHKIQLSRHEDYAASRRQGTSSAKPNNNAYREGPTCGIIPLGGSCEKVTTAGLRWNLNGDRLAFGGLVSTSNQIVDRTVTITTSDPLVFTAQVTCGSRSKNGDDDWDDADDDVAL